MTTRSFPRSYLLNVGMKRNDGKRQNTKAALFVAMQRADLCPMPGEKYYRSATELTAVLQFEKRPTIAQINTLCDHLAQDCIALYMLPSGDGRLYGPKAKAWGPFDGEYFILPNGRRAMQYGQAPPLGARPGKGHKAKKR